MKLGVFIKELQDLQTHFIRRSDFTGNRDKISAIISVGNVAIVAQTQSSGNFLASSIESHRPRNVKEIS